MSAGQPRWGFHRLSEDVAQRVVAAADVRPGDLVLDIGAGHGALTVTALAAGAEVVAVEAHAGRAASLRRRLTGQPVTVVAADLRELRWPQRPFTVVANPPWALLEELRERLETAPRLRTATLVVPRWLGRRWAERYPHARVAGSLRAEAFTPLAPTGGALVALTPRRTPRRPPRRR